MPLTDLQTVHIPAQTSALAIARKQIRLATEDWMAEEDVETAVLLTSELVANALKHGGAVGDVDLAFARRGDILWVGVSQPLPFNRRNGSDSNGWGLRLVETLAERWGDEVQPDGTTIVSFELRRNGQS